MRCEKCEGRKWVLGFGGIRKVCECANAKPVNSHVDKRSKEYRDTKKET